MQDKYTPAAIVAAEKLTVIEQPDSLRQLLIHLNASRDVIILERSVSLSTKHVIFLHRTQRVPMLRSSSYSASASESKLVNLP